MSVVKRKNPSGEIVWGYAFDKPGSTRGDRQKARKYGFATKREAEAAEATRRLDELQRHKLLQVGVIAPTATLPTNLGELIEEFFREYAGKKLELTTVASYRQFVIALSPDFLKLRLEAITPLHLTREWERLEAEGGRNRFTKKKQPLSPNSVRQIAGFVRSVFSRGVRWQLPVAKDLVLQSELPERVKRQGLALTVDQQNSLIEEAARMSPWCLQMMMSFYAGTGLRRGEALALDWSAFKDGEVSIHRSLAQTKEDGVFFKGTKNGETRKISVPPSILVKLEQHRRQQEEHKRHFESSYRTDLNLVFCQENGDFLKPATISGVVNHLFVKAKIDHPKGSSLHLLRHAHGSQLLADGVPLIDVSKRLGHKNVIITANIYAHQLEGRDKELAARWDDIQGRGHMGAHA